ncbi:dethiobiotin synthase [Parvicella tangerina]|uniref:ATP-dependent dethiobiotin synthetase BioD n=1 Tax=Parvicella tangerina TaxID=2829795 RepID=A0A916NHW1_9FLAO|nr:dethiobiotin synthase [Parvicella tangerina]CAG5082495.1 ATP-dependent dethiobiotin synthetase BioD 1 [Parvicella tangerina]
MKLFVTGIDTNVGKTVVSAILANALGYDYWKPIQSGDLKNSDTKKVKRWIDKERRCFPEAIKLKNPLSPHESARIDKKKIILEKFEAPKEENLIIEGAGGLMVPMNDKGDCMVDLIKHLDAKVVLVSKNYLGSINHTLMSCHVLASYGLENIGIIINGDPNPASEEIIAKVSGVPIIGHVSWTKRFTKKFLSTQGEQFQTIVK